jgi:hypothetical protein
VQERVVDGYANAGADGHGRRTGAIVGILAKDDGGAGDFFTVAQELNACRIFERVEWPRSALSSSSETWLLQRVDPPGA